VDDETIRIEVSPEELRRLVQDGLITISGVRLNYQQIGPFVSIEDRVRERWPLATKKNQRRIRDACLGMYRERVGRHPYKMTGHVNGTFLIEREYLGLLDRAIDLVRNEAEAREKMPLFGRRRR
jgi:hypothetical protein